MKNVIILLLLALAAAALASGVYLVRAMVGDQTTSKRIVYLK